MTKIFIVEDDDDIRETLIEVCQSEGRQVISAKNGKEALELLKQEAGPCMVLLDLMMPVMDGKTFLGKLQEELPGRQKDISIVVFSAGATFEHPLITGFLKKPVDLDEVLALLNGTGMPLKTA